MAAGVFVVKNEFPRLAVRLLADSKIAPDDAAQAWASAASAAAPVDTGRLSASGHAEGNEVVFDALNEQGNPYAAFVEYGTHDSPAQPFLRPTEDVGARVLERDLSAALEV